MTGLLDEIDEAKAKVARLEQAAAAATCAERGRHTWVSAGGRNCGCPGGECSVPVRSCEICKLCDYGQNDEAAAIVAACEVRVIERPPIDCTECEGTGHREEGSGPLARSYSCTTCDGTGKVPDDSTPRTLDDLEEEDQALAYAEEDCPGHVASTADPKVCRHCGTHIDSLRPDDDPGLKQPVKKFEDTFSAEVVVMQTYFPDAPKTP